MIIVLLIFSLFARPAFSETINHDERLRDLLPQLGLSSPLLEDFVVKKNLSKNGAENPFWHITAQKNERFIKIDLVLNIDDKSAQRYIEERISAIHSLYGRLPSPYPGMVSNSIDCPDKFKPEKIFSKIGDETAPLYFLYSTPRGTYGACVDELIQYRSALAFIYSKNEKIVYRLEIVSPKNKFDKEESLDFFRSLKFNQPKARIPSEIFLSRQIFSEKVIQQRQPEYSTVGWKNYEGYNLIIIGFDPLGANHVSSYGYSKATTPHFDQFAKKAFLFKDAVSPSSWTLPVFMSWFTSLYPSQHKIVNKYKVYTDKEQILSNLSELSPSVKTLAQILKENGYITAGFTGDAGVGREFGYNLGFDTYYDATPFGGFDIVFPKAIEWLQQHRKEQFFLFLQGYDVHGRHKLQDGFKGKFYNLKYKGQYKGTAEEYWNLRNLSLDQGFLTMTKGDVDFWRRWYDSKIYEADERLGNLLFELQRLRLMDKTIIVISSASGNEFYEHYKFDHGHSLYDELIQVPLAIKVPQVEGKVINDQVRTIDIMPTVLQLLNINYDRSLKKQIQGVSLTPFMEGKHLKLDAYSETDYLLYTHKRSLRTSDGWKLIYTMETEEKELYNLNDDPKELNNLIEKNENVASELEQKLFHWLSSMNQTKDYYKNLIKSMTRMN